MQLPDYKYLHPAATQLIENHHTCNTSELELELETSVMMSYLLQHYNYLWLE